MLEGMGDPIFCVAMRAGASLLDRGGEQNRYRQMAREFRRICAARPYLNHCIVARDVGARAFEISIDHLQLATRDAEASEIRHRIMAFVYVMTGAKFAEIGRAFGRNHSTVSYACDKYAASISAMVRE
jgi:hypothetical protein